MGGLPTDEMERMGFCGLLRSPPVEFIRLVEPGRYCLSLLPSGVKEGAKDTPWAGSRPMRWSAWGSVACSEVPRWSSSASWSPGDIACPF